MSHQIDDVVSPDVTAKAWDEYLQKFGPSAYVAARYIHASHLLPPWLDREPERDRTCSRPAPLHISPSGRPPERGSTEARYTG